MNQEQELQHKFYELVSKPVLEFCKEAEKNKVFDLEPFEVYVARKEYETLSQAQLYLEECKHAFQIVLGEMAANERFEELHQIIQGVEQVKSSLLTPQGEEYLKGLAKQGKTLAEAFGYSPDLMEKIYQIALSSSHRGHLEDAIKV